MGKNVHQNLYQQIPGVDRLLAEAPVAQAMEGIPPHLATQWIRDELDAVRKSLKSEDDSLLVQGSELSQGRVIDRILQRVQEVCSPSLRALINGTGIVLHTNFGRAPLSEEAIEAVAATGRGYSNLEYDLNARARGSRHDHVETLLKAFLGVEAALVVNNCAAAVLLGIAASSHGKETVVSRGELVEIGGSFRIPEVMESAGAILREVGTTNRTHTRDYENAIGPQTGLLLKAYRSNFEIIGFTTEVSVEELASIGTEHGIPTMMDLGCGLMVDLTPHGIHRGTQVQTIVDAGIDLICFSGDKLLGGPQCGIIVGKKAMIDKLKKHPMTRALRVDKMILSALEATLSTYVKGTWAQALPAHHMLTLTEEEAEKKAKDLRGKIEAALGKESLFTLTIVPTEGKVGGGTLPLQVLQGHGVRLKHKTLRPNGLEERLRLADTPIIGRVDDEGVILDVRTIFEWQYDTIISVLCQI
jgi:L-seryl-tRNA(Ser) seleniumtransferase